MTKLLARLVALCLLAPLTMGASSTKSPATLTSDASNGEFLPWINPSNAAASDDAYALRVLNSGFKTQYLKAADFGFTIPAGATINGVEVSVERRMAPGSSGNIRDSAVRLVSASGVIGSVDKAEKLTNWGTNDTIITYGDSSDLWEGEASTDWNSANAGVVFAAEAVSDELPNRAAQIDHIQITVYYTAAAGPTVMPRRSIIFGLLRDDGINLIATLKAGRAVFRQTRTSRGLAPLQK